MLFISELVDENGLLLVSSNNHWRTVTVRIPDQSSPFDASSGVILNNNSTAAVEDGFYISPDNQPVTFQLAPHNELWGATQVGETSRVLIIVV